jgi:SAM-dependent methyltransferase
MAQYQSFPGAPGDSHTVDKLKALRLPDLRGRSFLDVGCNEGFFCGFAHHQGASRSLGVDQSEAFIARARRRFPECEFLCQGWDRLPPEKFDAILLASALHYADDQSALIHRLVEHLTADGVLVLELGIVSSQRSEWVKVKRGIDERYFPTMPKLRELLKDHAWKWMGPSVNQAGDPVSRHVVHVSRRRPVAYLLLEPPGYGKSSIAASLFGRARLPVVSGDQQLDQAAKGKVQAPEALLRWLREGYSPYELDRVIGSIFEAGLARELVQLWLAGVPAGDFALDAYVPSERHADVERILVEAGYLPVSLRWNRVGPAALPMDTLAAQAEDFYLSLGAAGASPAAARAYTPTGFVDDVEVRDGKLLVRGWAIDAAGNLPRTLMVLTPAGLVEAPKVERQSRTDVQRHHDLPHALVGYLLEVDADGATRVEDLRGAFAVSAGEGLAPFRHAGTLSALLEGPRTAEDAGR